MHTNSTATLLIPSTKSTLSNNHSKRQMAEESKPKWEGKASVKLSAITAEQAWPLLEDFCNLHKLFPLDTCYCTEGTPGQPGLIRYCAFTITSDVDDPIIMWAKEKLLLMDPIQRCLSYEIVDSNMGFKSYVATMKVLPNDEEDDHNSGCWIELSFVCDPMETWRFEDLYSRIETSLQHTAKKMEEHILHVSEK